MSFVIVLVLILSLVFPFVAKPLLIKLHVIDIPNERSSHQRPTIRGLGLATWLAMLFGYLVLFVFADSAEFSSLWVIAIISLLAGLLGLAEDIRGVPVTIRSIFQLALGAAATICVVALDGASWLWVPYGVLFISSYINVANFMDGINGISGLHGVLAGANFIIAGILSAEYWLAFSGAILGAAFLGFLPWNLIGKGAFLGDVGSYLLGGAVATTSIAAAVAGVPWLATIAPMIFYFGDVAATLVSRVRRGEKWHEPHREHVYERIQQMGYSHMQTAGLVTGFTATACGLGIASFWVSGWGWWLLLASGLALTAIYLLLPRILPQRHARVA